MTLLPEQLVRFQRCLTWYPIKTTPLQVPPAYEPKGGKSAKVKPALLEKGKDKRDSRGRLVFEDFPKFRPTLRPKDVIQAGSFGG